MCSGMNRVDGHDGYDEGENMGGIDETSTDDAAQHDGDSLQRIDPTASETVTLSATIDVSDLDQREREVLVALAQLYEDAFLEVATKNRDYGWSFLRTGSKLAATEGIPFDSAVRAQAFGLLTRTGDKRERLIENVFGDGTAQVSDSPGKTAKEAGNYWFFKSFILDNPDLADSFLSD